MKNIDRNAYLKYALSLTQTECSRREQFSEWLPQEIIDCHAHSNLEQHVISMSERTRAHMLSTFPYFSLEESKTVQEMLYPGKRVRTLRFPKTFRGIDHRAANTYLLSQSGADDRIAIFGLPEDVSYTIGMLSHTRVSALKMYYSYWEPPATKIYEYFLPEILEEAQGRGIPIILHVPRIITTCKEDVTQVIRDFPRLRIVLAHLGLPMFLVPGLEETYTELASASENVFMDTSLNTSAEVIGAAISIFGTERIMYGSDEPLNLVRACAYSNPKLGQRLITDYPYHWVDIPEHEEFKHIATDVTHLHWQSLEGLRSTIMKMQPSEQEQTKKRIFCQNASSLFGF